MPELQGPMLGHLTDVVQRQRLKLVIKAYVITN